MTQKNLIQGIAISFLIFVVSLLMGCAMDTQHANTAPAQKPDALTFMPIIPPSLDAQVPAKPTQAPNAVASPEAKAQAVTPETKTAASQPETKTEDVVPQAKPVTKPTINTKSPLEQAKALTDESIPAEPTGVGVNPFPHIDAPHVGLHIDPDRLKHKIVISIVSDPDRFGDVEEIEVDMTQDAYYTAVIMLSGIPKLSITRTGASQATYEYELTRVHNGANGDILVQSDDNQKINMRDFGETEVLRIQNPKTGEITFIEKPLYRKKDGEHPVYAVQKIHNQWTASFETEITKALYQMREERKMKDQKGVVTETQFVEFQEGVDFSTIRQELFASTLSIQEVQKTLKRLNIQLAVSDIISISNYISIYASDQPIETTH